MTLPPSAVRLPPLSDVAQSADRLGFGTRLHRGVNVVISSPLHESDDDDSSCLVPYSNRTVACRIQYRLIPPSIPLSHFASVAWSKRCQDVTISLPSSETAWTDLGDSYFMTSISISRQIRTTGMAALGRGGR